MKRLLPFAVIILAAACADATAPLAPTTESASALMASQTAAAKAGKVDVCHIDDLGLYKLLNVSGNALKAHLGHGDGLPGAGGLGADCSVVVEPFSFVTVGAVGGQLYWIVEGGASPVSYEVQVFIPPPPGPPLPGQWAFLETVTGTGTGTYTSAGYYGVGNYRVVATLSDASVVISPEIIF